MMVGTVTVNFMRLNVCHMRKCSALSADVYVTFANVCVCVCGNKVASVQIKFCVKHTHSHMCAHLLINSIKFTYSQAYRHFYAHSVI